MDKHFDIRAVFCPQSFLCLRSYDRAQFGKDVMAGIIVGIIAIPLAIAFGISSGVGPTEGLVTAIVAGFLISLLGGTRVQIGGPTGAFIVIIYGIIQQFGLSGLLMATVMAGILLVAMGLLRLGAVIRFVPYPVIVGFTAGIALTILTTQINDLFGLGLTDLPANFIDKWIYYAHHVRQVDGWSLAIGLGSLLIIIFTPRVVKHMPGSLLAIVVATLAVWLLRRFGGVESVRTISDLYELPHGLPAPHLPTLQLEEGQTFFQLIQQLFPAAFTIAMLGAIESLLSAMVADGVTGDRHDSNTELIGQGIANIVVPFFGGIPATGAIARTMANINSGGRTPVAGLVHAVVLLLVLLFMGGLVGMIPMPCLAAVLVMVAYNMSGWRTIVGMLRDPKSDLAVLAVTFLLTVVFDLTVAIEVGMLLSVVLFLRRVSLSTSISVFRNEIDPNQESDLKLHEEKLHIPDGVEVYEIDGPYFFGIANKFDDMVRWVGNPAKVRVIRMRKVPFVDATGLHNLEMLCQRSHRVGTEVVLSGVRDNVRVSLLAHGFGTLLGEENICPNINVALARAARLAKAPAEVR
ncbi:MAG: sulfate permease [Paludibacteraceae bacterium]|nr:sulfate permease [Paludibacteraceae bacterium]